jgi:hypothetical protein
LLTASFVLAWLSYEIIEKRGIRMRHKIRRGATRDIQAPTVDEQAAVA